jgi:hypothetical protein
MNDIATLKQLMDAIDKFIADNPESADMEVSFVNHYRGTEWLHMNIAIVVGDEISISLNYAEGTYCEDCKYVYDKYPCNECSNKNKWESRGRNKDDINNY